MRVTIRLLAGLGVVLGACGDTASNGSSLVSVEDEPAGANCELGGTVIRTGSDTDQDQVLDDGEVTQSEYICATSAPIGCGVEDVITGGPVTLRQDTDFDALADVTCIDGDLLVVGSESTRLPALPALATVTGSVIVAGNPNLESLDGLRAIRDVGGKYMVQGNAALTDVAALGLLRRFQGLALVGNDSLTDLAGLDPFTELPGGLQIANNSSLVSLHGLEHVTRGLRDRVTISSNRSLSDIGALSNLRSVVLLEFIGNPALATVSLPSLERVEVYVNVANNVALTTLSLPALTTTAGLQVRMNPTLTEVDLPELSLSGTTAFEQNLMLSELGAPKLAYVSGDLVVTNSARLTHIRAPALVAVGGQVQLNQLPGLTSLEGLEQLSSIGGTFTLQSCALVQSFAGLGSLVDVANLTVSRNQALNSFAGLDSFQKVGGNLVISMNPALSLAAAQEFADSITVGGATSIN
jgi:hypothetical protein